MSNAYSIERWFPALLTVLFLCFAGWVIYASRTDGLAPVPFSKIDFVTLGQMFAGLLLIALIIERVVELIINASFVKSEESALQPIHSILLDASEKGIKLTDLVDKNAEPEEHFLLINKLIKERPELFQDAEALHVSAAYEEWLKVICQKTVSAFFLASAFGLLCSLFGFQVLSVVTDAFSTTATVPANGQTAENLLTMIDVLVSGFLIGGGATTIHGIINPWLSALDQGSLSSFVKHALKD